MTVRILNDQREVVSSFQWKFKYFYASGSIRKTKKEKSEILCELGG